MGDYDKMKSKAEKLSTIQLADALQKLVHKKEKLKGSLQNDQRKREKYNHLAVQIRVYAQILKNRQTKLEGF